MRSNGSADVICLFRRGNTQLNAVLGSMQEMHTDYGEEFLTDADRAKWGEVYAIRFPREFVEEFCRATENLFAPKIAFHRGGRRGQQARDEERTGDEE